MNPTETDTKTHILTTGRLLTAQRGYTGVGLSELLKAAGVPKGSFYHYFASKEAYGCALLDTFVCEYELKLADTLNNKNLDARQRLLSYFSAWRQKQASDRPEDRCLVVKLAAEVADLSEDMSAILMRGIQGIEKSLADTLRSGVAEGSISVNTDPDELASSLYHMWLGASLVASVAHSADALDTAYQASQTMIPQP